ncbi:MAG: TIGR00266 family protein [Myxococcales bacterium]|nr:TIGR00266 family protein [Myxococcales bacterium]
MAHQVTHGPSFAMLRADLEAGQEITAEAGAMVARHPSVTMHVSMNADPAAGLLDRLFGFAVAVLRKFLGGETFFVNRFRTVTRGSVWIAPVMAGQVKYHRMRGGRIVLSAGAYLAHAGRLRTKIRFGGLRTILAREGAFFLEIRGEGDLWFTSYGGVHAVDVDGSYLVDNGHLVGYEGSLTLTVGTGGGGALGLVASGEGVACEFRGKGRVWLQSRNPNALVHWLSPVLPK